MKFQMHENSLFAILLRSQWWASLAVALVITALANMLLPRAYVVYGVFAALPFYGIAAIVIWRQLQKPSAGRVSATLEAVRNMSWPDFATAMEEGFRRDGYTVSRVDLPAADFEMLKGMRSALVSAKRWKAGRTGIEPLRELYAAKEAREAHEAIYVATGEVTDNARAFAAEKKIRLLQGAELAALLPRR
jgi:restriction system protein